MNNRGDDVQFQDSEVYEVAKKFAKSHMLVSESARFPPVQDVSIGRRETGRGGFWVRFHYEAIAPYSEFDDKYVTGSYEAILLYENGGWTEKQNPTFDQDGFLVDSRGHRL